MNRTSNPRCLKGTQFMCPCDNCMEESRQKGIAHFEHLAQLKTSTAGYWTSQYSARDKADTVIILHAGFDHGEKCGCLFCQVERYEAREARA